MSHAYGCCDSPRGCAWPDDHSQPCKLHHGCDQHPYANPLQAEIDRLRAELASVMDVQQTENLLHKALDRAEQAEARLAAVLALCDDPPTPSRMLIAYVRAATTGDTK